MVKRKGDIEMAVDEAAAWDARLRAPNCTDDERADYRAWRAAQSENAETFETLQDILSCMRAEERAPEISSMREAALSDARRAARSRRARFWGVGLAAGLALLVGVSVVFVLSEPDYVGPFDTPDGATMHVPPYYATAVGERSTITLEDGTVATLNTDTRLRVDYKDSERLVTLFHGQALFDVAKNPERPFVVAAGDRRITAVGTVFDVRYDLDKVQVTMLEGVVEVAADDDRAATEGAQTDEGAPPITLRVGQQLLADNELTGEVVRETDVERATVWREGRVFFDDASLTDAISEMNRYSTTQIIASDPALAGFRVNGMFRTGQQANFVDAVTTYFPINANQVADDRIVLRLSQLN